ncbi:MAG: hypothetical protein HQ582_24745 [Planctomycetes bacterium]|nr:hypothetical protein [Planctomycetota bacterium]
MVHRLSLAAHCWFAVLSLSVAPCSLWAQEDDPALRGRFLTGVAQTARKLEKLSFRAQCEYTSADKGVGASDEIDRRNYEMAIRGPYALETGLNKNRGTVFVRVRNDSYAFGLERSAEGERTSLQFLEQIGVDPSIDAGIAESEVIPRAMALAAYYLWTEPLSRVVESDSFSIKRVYGISSGSNELARVEFEYLVDDPVRKIKQRFSDGFLVCDPAREWVLTEYGATHYNFINEFTAALTTVLEHGDAIGEMPIATKITQRMKGMRSADDDYTSESVITLEITSRDVPEEEFYLTHYGLPEPTFRRGWLGVWAWYLIAGIVCLGVGTMVLKRRRASV